MKFNIIQLSDIHLKTAIKDNPIIKRRDKIFDSIKNEILDAEFNVLVVTGDIAMSGEKEQYAIAETFFNEMLALIETYTKKKCYFISIPGNHDCFLKKNLIRDKVINSFSTDGFGSIDDDIIDLCCGPQAEYFSWRDKMYKSNDDFLIIGNSKIAEVIEIKKGNFNLIFNCFNTSWVSLNPENYGTMVFPTNYFDSSYFHNNSNITFNLIHHPFNWQAQTNYREFKKFLEESGDIVLSGHEHTQSMQMTMNNTGIFTGYIEAGALQDSKNSNVSSFNLLKFNIESESYKLEKFDLQSESYIKSNESNDLKFQHRFNLGKKEFLITKDFKTELNYSGAPFIHTIYGEVNLIDEIFIFPELRKISDNYSDTSIKFPAIINSQELFDKEENIRFIFTGDESCGKSTLIKRMFSHYYEKNFVPILLSGEDLSEVDPLRFRKKLKNNFLQQYEPRLSQKFDELDNDRIILIIDDYQKCTLKQEIKFTLVKSLTEVYKNLIFTGNATILFLPFINKAKKQLNAFEDFAHFHVLEFNVELRHNLINKWNLLGRDDYENRNVVVGLTEKADKHIKNLLSTNLLPSNPISILTLLQALEIQGSSDNVLINSFDLFVGNSIHKNIKKKEDYDFYIDFLTFYCYFLFDEKMRDIDKDSFNTIFKKYLAMGNFDMNFEEVLSTLQKAKIIRIRENDIITLANKYTYYYFIAKQISQKLHEPDYKKLVIKISNRVYKEEYYHIILFLTNFSKEPFIIENLYNNANDLFKDMPVAKLEDDITLINSLVDSLPKLVVESIRSDKELTDVVKEKIELEESENAAIKEVSNKHNDLDEDLNNIDLLTKFILAIKTFEILGKIVQKNWASPNSDDKLKYSEATFNLALRTLSFYFSIMVDNKEGIINYLKVIASKKNLEDLTDIKDISNKFLFSFSYQASYGIIKRCSNAIGHPKLNKVFDTLIEKNPIMSYRLINLSIELDHLDHVPLKRIEGIFEAKGFNKNYLPKYLIQNFVFNHIRMYHTSLTEKQKICSLVGIDIKNQLVADQSSKEKK